jgi:hypothetical protein
MSTAIKDKIEELLSSLGISYSAEVVYIFLLIVYISIVSIYTPRALLSFVNKGIVKLVILLYIFYVVCIETDIILGMFLLVAFVVTISLDNSIQAAKELQPAEEGFKNKEDDDDDDDEDNEVIKVKVNAAPVQKKEKPAPRHEDFVNDEEDEEQFEDMMQNKAIKDVFQNLHESIHELQSMVKK